MALARIESSDPNIGQVYYLTETFGDIYLSSTEMDRLAIANDMDDDRIQCILSPIRTPSGKCEWKLSTHDDHICYVRFM